MKVYVVSEPASIAGIYDTWEECRAKVSGVRGARYQGVDSREKAEQMLHGGVVLPPGKYAFTDGNHHGGVGIVHVTVGTDGKPSATETSTTVDEIFADGEVLGLDSPSRIAGALRARRNILAEMAALYEVLRTAPKGAAFTVVHDYKGVAEWLDGHWKAKDRVLAALVQRCRDLKNERRLEVTFRYQRGHQSTWAGRDDFAEWNRRADELATEAVAERTLKGRTSKRR